MEEVLQAFGREGQHGRVWFLSLILVAPQTQKGYFLHPALTPAQVQGGVLFWLV
jgi:hypothetical protein